MKHKVTIQEPKQEPEAPEWVVNGLYEMTASGLFHGEIYLATTDGYLVNLCSGGHWAWCSKFNGSERDFRRLPPGTKVTIEVAGS